MVASLVLPVDEAELVPSWCPGSHISEHQGHSKQGSLPLSGQILELIL